MSSPLKIIFAGTPDFASTALGGLLETQHEVIAVYTQPDRPSGRGQKLKISPVKQLAEQNSIPVFQPKSFKDAADIEPLQQLQADIMIVAAYGIILPKVILDAPRLGCLNIHASLLPRWRGAAPIQRAILAGDTESGITIMQMDEGLDTGDILLKKPCLIDTHENSASLHDRLSQLGTEAIVETLEQLRTLIAVEQDNSQAIYAKKLSKREAQIDWQQDNVTIERFIRAFNPWPVAYTGIADKTLRIHQASAIEASSDDLPGRVITCAKIGIDIACGRGALRLLHLQAPGKKAMDTSAFLNGNPDLLKAGTILGAKND